MSLVGALLAIVGLLAGVTVLVPKGNHGREMVFSVLLGILFLMVFAVDLLGLGKVNLAALAISIVGFVFAYKTHKIVLEELARMFPIKEYWPPHGSWLLEFPKELSRFLRDEREGLADELLEKIQNAVRGIGSCCLESGTFKNLDIYATNDLDGRRKAERVAKVARPILWKFMKEHNLG